MHPREQFGAIDVYLFDQILRGRFDVRRRVLDVGCGGGRNLRWFLRAGCEVHGVDPDPRSVAAARDEARAIGGEEAAARIVEAEASSLPLGEGTVDAVLLNAVLHFARDEAHFDAILDECARVLAPGGLFFARLCTSIGLEALRDRPVPGWVRLPDGSGRFVVDRAKLEEGTRRLGGRLADPVKTTLVEDQRAMTTWVVVKSGE